MTAAEWGDPDLALLSSGRPDPPPCPVDDVFHPRLAKWICDRAALSCAPVDYVVGALLGFVATVIGITYVVMPWPGWTEPLVIWFLNVGDSGDSKSPAVTPITKAIYALQSKVNYAKAQAYKKARKDWKDADEPEDAEPEKPKYLQIISTDTTAEALLSVLFDNPRGVMRYSDEIKSIIKSFGRYYSSSEGGERQAMLEAYDAQPKSVNRQSFKDDDDGDGSNLKVIDHFYVCYGR